MSEKTADNFSANKAIDIIEWQTLEYDHQEKPADWFWLVGLISVLGIIISVVVMNFLLAVIILIAGFTVMMYGARPPEEITVILDRRGVRIKNQVYPYSNITAFALRDDEEPHKLHLHIDRLFLPHLSVNLEEIPPETIRTHLAKYLPEEPYEEHLLDLIAERLGF
ncbi:MAG: hypothetical protein WDZ85_02990 [Candidatus Paceibacterota bacterium]